MKLQELRFRKEQISQYIDDIKHDIDFLISFCNENLDILDSGYYIIYCNEYNNYIDSFENKISKSKLNDDNLIVIHNEKAKILPKSKLYDFALNQLTKRSVLENFIV